MNLLVDTQLILWGLKEPERLSAAALALFRREDVSTVFSAASIWEVAIKSVARRAGFDANPREIRRVLIERGWRELGITADHAAATSDLPPIHSDPFDRILAAQSRVEGLHLVTSDEVLARYPGDIVRV